jgi:hypothetical protein
MSGSFLPSLPSCPPSPQTVRSVVTFIGGEEAKEEQLSSAAPSALSEALRRYGEAGKAKAVTWQQLSRVLDGRRRGPFTEQRHVAPLGVAFSSSGAIAPPSPPLQPAWNGGVAYDWNGRLPYPGADALRDVRGGHDSGGVLSPSTLSYHRHIRRASLDTRTGSAQPSSHHLLPPSTDLLGPPSFTDTSSVVLSSSSPLLSRSAPFVYHRLQPPSRFSIGIESAPHDDTSPSTALR